MSTQTIFKTAGATSRHVDVQLVQKAAATNPGDPLTALAFNTSSLVCWYRLGATGTLTQITLLTQTVTGAYSSGGFVQIDATNAPGGYRFDIPNACLATAGECNIWFTGAASLATHHLKIIVMAVDLFTSPNVLANVVQRMSLPEIPRYQATAIAGSTPTTVRLPPSTQFVAGDDIEIVLGTGVGQKVSSTAYNAATGDVSIYGTWPQSVPSTDSVCERTLGVGVPAAPGDILASFPQTGAGNIKTDVGEIVGTPATTISGDIAAAKAELDTLIARLTALRAGYLDNLSAGAVAQQTTSTAIKAKTDNLPTAPADETLVIAATNALATAIGAVSTSIGSPVNGTLALDNANLSGRIPDALVSGRLKALVAAVQNQAITSAAFATGAIDANALDATAVAELVAAIRVMIIESNGNRTLQQVLSIILATCAGISTDNGDTFKDPSGTAVRAAYTTDGFGNRLAATLTPST